MVSRPSPHLTPPHPAPALALAPPPAATMAPRGAGAQTPAVVKGAPTEKARVPSRLPGPGAEQRFTALEADGQGSNSLLLTKVKVPHVLTPVGPQS